MTCLEKIYSVSVLTGNGACNANCSFCAGKYLREQAKENPAFFRNLRAALKLSSKYGGWSLSITGSGEPTCDTNSVWRVLDTYNSLSNKGINFPNVNLFTNGILLADDKFCSINLPVWSSLGLNNIAVSIHSTDEKKQAEAYGLLNYPSFDKMFSNIRKYNLGVRATLLLRKGEVDNAIAYKKAIHDLLDLKVNNITSWTVGNPDGSRNEFTPSRLGMLSIKAWLMKNAKCCHEHSWGGGVYDYKGNILRLTDYVTKHDPKKDFVRQLVVFQDGTVAYSWIKEGALCFK